MKSLVIAVMMMFGHQTDDRSETFFSVAKVSVPIVFTFTDEGVTSPSYGKCFVHDNDGPLQVTCTWTSKEGIGGCEGIGSYMFIPSENGEGVVYHSQLRACPPNSHLKNDVRAMVGTWKSVSK